MVVRRYSTTHSDGARVQEPRAVEAILSRYRNLIILAITVVCQLLLLAWQVRTNQDVRLIRVWAVTAVTPMAGVVEAVRRNTIGFLEDYFILLDVREQNRKLREENSRLKMENVYFRNQLQTAEHAQALKVFQAQSPSTTVAARVIGNGTASSAQVVFIDRGSTSGIERGMAVVTPDGVVGKVIAVYPAGCAGSAGDRSDFCGRRRIAKRRMSTARCTATGQTARWSTSRTKRRWKRANGFTLPEKIEFSRKVSRSAPLPL